MKSNLIIEGTCVKGFVDVYEKEIVIPYGITKIDSCAFEEYYGLEKVVLPKSLVEIGDNAFRKCVSLKMVFIPENVTVLGQGVFEYCESLRLVDFLHMKIKEIPSMTFFSCKSLKTILLPDCIERIGKFAFCGCGNIECYSTPPMLKIYESVPYSSSLHSIHIPDTVIYLEQAPHKETRITISEERYERFKELFSQGNEIELCKYNIYQSFINERMDKLEDKMNAILHLLTAHPGTITDMDDVHVEMEAELLYELSNMSIKEKIEKMIYIETDEEYDYETRVNFFMAGKDIRFKNIHKDFGIISYEYEGVVEHSKWGLFEKERIGLMNNNDKGSIRKKQWSIHIEFRDGSYIDFSSTNFKSEEYELVKEKLGSCIYLKRNN